MKFRETFCYVTGLALVAVALAVLLPRAEADILVFGDGFVIEGRVKEKFEPLFDPNGSVQIRTSDPFRLDDGVRTIWFSPFQIKEPLRDKTKPTDQIIIKKPSPVARLQTQKQPLNILSENAADWNNRWERDLTLVTPTGKVVVKQRITLLTPDSIRVESTTHDWVVNYQTKEFDPQVLRSLIYKHMAGLKDKEKETDIRLTAYRFLLQAGFTEQADKELNDLVRDFPEEKSNVAGLQQNIRRIYAVQLAAALSRADKAGLHQEIGRKLDQYAKQKLDDLLDETMQLQVQAIKDKYKATEDKVQQARRLLAVFAELVPPSMRTPFKDAAAVIGGELTADNVDRLDTFIGFALDYERAVKNRQQPDQTAAEVMAFALTGWLRGSDAAERTVDIALKHWEGRKLLLQYLRTDDPLLRKNKLLPAIKAQIGVDEAMQIIGLMPPVDAHKTIDTKVQTLQTQNDGKKFNYDVLLPPGYNHGRSWPVLMTLHHAVEMNSEAIGMWANLAAEYGFIVVAPQWSNAKPPAPAIYAFSAQEHSAALETLRDLRRRFQVDNDRVFLFGVEQGGNMAFDVGFSHPDQFAGVVPMAGTPAFFVGRYWSNAQNLNLYVVNGDQAGVGDTMTEKMFKDDTIRCNFPAIYAQYKGRKADWFSAERPIIFDWMNRKRRANPLKQVGKVGQEFKTHRTTDNQFYWIGTSSVMPACINSAAGWNTAVRPAILRAEVKAKNDIYITTGGVSSVTILFMPQLVNYGEKVKVTVNGNARKPLQVTPNLDTLLNTLYETGDRQRLCLARLDLS